jgi:hypothetical protein
MNLLIITEAKVLVITVGILYGFKSLHGISKVDTGEILSGTLHGLIVSFKSTPISSVQPFLRSQKLVL